MRQTRYTEAHIVGTLAQAAKGEMTTVEVCRINGIFQIAEDDIDVLHALVKEMAEILMRVEGDAICGASNGERGVERANRGNGYRHHAWDTRAGTIELSPRKLREGSYFPGWPLTPRKRSEQALVAAIADAYLAGVSTRRVDKLVRTLGIDGISKSGVSRLVASLDGIVTAFRDCPLGGPLPARHARRPGGQGARGRTDLQRRRAARRRGQLRRPP